MMPPTITISLSFHSKGFYGDPFGLQRLRQLPDKLHGSLVVAVDTDGLGLNGDELSR